MTDRAALSARPEPLPFDFARTPLSPARTLIEASAGTGKTFALAGVVLRLALDGGSLVPDDAPPEAADLPDLRRLLVMTFTEAATQELQDRIRAALRGALRAARGEPIPEAVRPLVEPILEHAPEPERHAARLQAALDRVDEAAVTTIHGFCRRALAQFAFEAAEPFDTTLEDNLKPLRRRAAADVWAALTHADPWLAHLAVAKGWALGDLLALQERAARFPGTRLRPEAKPLADTLADLRDAAARLGAVLDPEALLPAVRACDWNRGKPLGEDPAGTLARVAAFAAGRDFGGLEAVEACTPEAVVAQGTKRSNAQKEALARLAAEPAFVACGAVVEAVGAVRLALVHAFVTRISVQLDDIKRRRRLVGFDDLLGRLRDALEAEATGPALAEALRGTFAVALIDEFQDTDAVQFAIVERVFSGRPLFLIGDPKQAIYAFRGADLHVYLRAQRTAEARFALGTNFRSCDGLVRGVNALFGLAPRPFFFPDITFEPVRAHRPAPRLAGDDRPPMVWWRLDADRPLSKGQAKEQIARGIVLEIQRLLSDGMTLGDRPLVPEDIAVLVRTNDQARQLQALLREAGVPAVVGKSGDVRESEEAEELERLLHAVAQPHDEGLLRAALATRLWGQTATDLVELDADALAEHRATLEQALRRWRRRGLRAAVNVLLERLGTAERWLALPGGERRLTNLRHLLDLLHEHEQREAASPEDLLHVLHTRTDTLGGGRDQTELRLESDARAVQLVTVHSSKGLQYPIVFLPSLWDVAWKTTDEARPLVHAPDGVEMHVEEVGEDGAAARAAFEAETMAELVRLAYVALTRAAERCYVAWGHINGAADSALGYLLADHDDASGELVAFARARRAAARGADPSAVLDALVDAAPDCIAVEPLPSQPRPRLASTASRDASRSPRILSPSAGDRLDSPWRPVSFSAWASGRDANPARPDLAAGLDEPRSAPREPVAEAGLHAFAAGPVPGRCLHELLQFTDFAARLSPPEDPAKAEGVALAETERIGRTLARYGLDRPARHRAPISPHAEAVALLDRVAGTPLPGLDVPLGAIPREQLAAEWRFVLPIGRTSPAALAEAFRRHAGTPLDRYADTLDRLSARAADGFLTGLVDLLACHDDRWFVIDWKSNHLGPRAEHYTGEAMARAMEEHHYLLQYHLYLVALHRFLRSRLGAAYDYETHVGGALYVFLRGLDEAGAGVYADRPSADLIAALDAALR